MSWIETELLLPELGLKVLCELNGDIYVGMRLKDNQFICFPKHDNWKDLMYPNRWHPIEFPVPLRGMWLLVVDGKLITMQEFKEKNSTEYEEFVDCILENKAS